MSTWLEDYKDYYLELNKINSYQERVRLKIEGEERLYLRFWNVNYDSIKSALPDSKLPSDYFPLTSTLELQLMDKYGEDYSNMLSRLTDSLCYDSSDFWYSILAESILLGYTTLESAIAIFDYVYNSDRKYTRIIAFYALLFGQATLYQLGLSEEEIKCIIQQHSVEDRELVLKNLSETISFQEYRYFSIDEFAVIIKDTIFDTREV